MAGQVQAGDLLLHFQQLRGRIFRQIRNLVIVHRLFLAAAHQAEQIHLAVQILPCIGLHAFQDALNALQHTMPGGLQIVERTCLDKIFQCAAVEACAV